MKTLIPEEKRVWRHDLNKKRLQSSFYRWSCYLSTEQSEGITQSKTTPVDKRLT